MEERPIGIDRPEEDNEKPIEKKGRYPSFIEYFMRHREDSDREKSEEETDDDEEKENGPDKHRLRKVFRRLFGRIATVEKMPVNEPEEPLPAFNPDVTATTRQEVPKNPVLAQENEWNMPLEIEAKEQSRTDETEAPALQREELDTPVYAQEQEQQPDEQEQGASGAGIEIPLQASMDNEAVDLPEIKHQDSFRPSDRDDNHKHWQEAVTAGLVVDQMSRWRDRKIKRQVRQQDKIIDQLKEKIEAANNTSERQLPPTESPTPERRNIVRSFERSQPTPEKAIKRPELRLPTDEQIEVVTGSPEAILLAEKEQDIAPVEVLKEVTKVVEKGVAIESLYERRAEIKDEPTPEGSAVAVGSILAAMKPRVAASDEVLSAESLRALSPTSAAKTSPDLYKTAAINGFWAAICIIVLAAIAYLVVN